MSNLLEAAARSLAVAVVLAAALRLMRIRNPQSLSVIWTVVLVCALAMPVLMPAVAAIMVSAPPTAVAWIPAASSSPFFLRPLVSPTMENSTPFLDLLAVAIVYGIVAGVLLFRLIVGVLRGYRLRRDSISLNQSWTEGWDIRVSNELHVPVTYGRTILLPQEWPNWSEFKRNAIVVHERSHVWRNDFYVQLMAGVHRAVFWFSPLAWWLQDQLLKASENACDDAAIEKVGDRVSYAEILLDLTKLRSNDRLVGVAMARGKTVGGRIERILRETRVAGRISIFRQLLIIASIVLLAGFAAGSWRVEAETGGLPVYAVALPPPATPQQTAPQPASVPAAPTDIGALGNWIEEEVPDISTDVEQAAFKLLRTDEEREAFIAQFWLRRDPTPGTTDNEFRSEYYRRIVLANQYYSTLTTPGHKTERGRVLIRFGQPDELETHALGGTSVRGDGVATTTPPFEKWRYRSIDGIGQDVILEFVDVDRTGDYRLTLGTAEQNRLIRTNR